MNIYTQKFTETISFHVLGLALEPSLSLREGLNYLTLKGGIKK